MAISCGKCWRQYDVTLFEFGRTIDCACGMRVGFEHKLVLPKTGEIKFFADVNVARLVRWLRAIGIDTWWEDAISDADLVGRAIRENRFVLTLDKRLVKEWRTDNVLLLTSEKPLEQFAQVVEHFKLKLPAQFFTRCLVCNSVLRRASATEIAANVPPRVRENNELFYYCPNCEKIYWEGSHTKRMQAAIEDVFNLIPPASTEKSENNFP
ncbi:MAG: Mut7-C RNAse domain-containing protein [Acidobacteriota bacterium]|nr:Mut7-C RNAse domain-containing protein [Acidobacteriota bacterium]